MTTVGLGPMLRVQWRTRRRSVLGWLVALIAGMVGTAAAVAGLYSTPQQIHGYAEAVTAGDALAAINGRVEGIDTLGGVIADEFGFLAAFVMPLLGISLVAGVTRREEEAGRLEAVLAGRVARHVPVLAGIILAAAAIAIASLAFTLGLAVVGVPAGRAALYSASLGALAWIFAGWAAVLSQLTRHVRGVYVWSLIALTLAYLLRGVGDATRTWVTWLSPLGWSEKVAPFATMRWWVLGIPLALGGLCGGTAVLVAARRDLGSAWAREHVGSASATRWLRTPLGLAGAIHRPTFLGWLAGSVLVAGMMGGLARQFVDAVSANPAMADAVGMTTTGRPEDGLVAVTQLYLAVVVMGYVVQAVGSLREEEASGRLEVRLSGTLSRWRWLAAHQVVILTGLVALVLASSLVLATTASWSTGAVVRPAQVLAAGAAYLPAELVVAGLALVWFGVRPRASAAGWASFAVIAFIALLGPGLGLAGWVLDLAPTTHVGRPPTGPTDVRALVVMTSVAVALFAAAAVALRRRGVPQL